jgi:ribonuclease T2
MPGYASALYKHEWIKHGTCYGTDASRYYSDAAHWTDQIAQGSVGRLLQSNIGKRITLRQLRKALGRDFGDKAGEKLDLRCDHGKISELWIHIGGDSSNLKDQILAGSHTHSRCQGGIVDAPGYER